LGLGWTNQKQLLPNRLEAEPNATTTTMTTPRHTLSKLANNPHQLISCEMAVSDRSSLSSYDFETALTPSQPVTRSQSAKAASALVSSKKNGEPVAKRKPERQFTLFPKLPLELRLMIWKHAAEPRVIKLSHYRVEWPRNEDNEKDPTGELRRARKVRKQNQSWGSWCRTRALQHQVPTIFTICKESRETAKETYHLCFEKELDGQKIWVDFSRDTIFFVDFYAFQAFYGIEQPWKTEDREMSNNILPDTAIMEKELQVLVAGSVLCKEVVKVLSRFHSLQKLILQLGSLYNVDRLQSDLTKSWSKLERLPQLEQWDKKDLREKYFIQNEEVSMISLRSRDIGSFDDRNRMMTSRTRQDWQGHVSQASQMAPENSRSLKNWGQGNERFSVGTNLSYTDDMDTLISSANFETAIAI
jgi:hypothetical protein